MKCSIGYYTKMATVATRISSMGFGPAFTMCMTFNLGLTAVCTTYMRSLGADYGGCSTGQPRTTDAGWAASTRQYLMAQKCNPIRHFGDSNWKIEN